MPLIANAKCDRCGQRHPTRRHDGEKLCRPCLTRLLADAEGTRRCPVDGEPMQKHIVKDIILDHCPECRGLWLDRGELDRLKTLAREEGENNFATGFIAGLG